MVTIFLAGQETGNAWADVLMGSVNPSGKLPVTFPLRDGDLVAPCEGRHSNHCVYEEGLNVSWRGMIGKEVGFPFGHGLSYTSFGYSWVQQPHMLAAGANMSIEVVNTGSTAGAEVAQLYLRFPASTGEPDYVLRGFAKTSVLQPAARQQLVFELSRRDLSVYEEGSAEPGVNVLPGWRYLGDGARFGIAVGSHSRDVRLEAELVTA